jgi:hypothetical protein
LDFVAAFKEIDRKKNKNKKSFGKMEDARKANVKGEKECAEVRSDVRGPVRMVV